uniref:serine-rich adhesin for platelets-like isoform X3 n=1 Tax=Styela clava TaxID=7725 RepID=UPI001939A1A0|nr:serine-rich adhesin for platelets-like isoform X3 [Styela clava]
MDISPAMTADFAVFDEVLADLNKLRTSLDKVTQKQKTRDAKSASNDNRGHTREIYDENVPTLPSKDNLEKARLEENAEDNIIKRQTNGSTSQAHSKISVDNIFNSQNNNRKLSKNDGRCYGYNEPALRQSGAGGQNDAMAKTRNGFEEEMNNKEYLLNDTGNCVSSDISLRKQYTSFKTSDDGVPDTWSGGATSKKEKLTNGISKEAESQCSLIISNAAKETDVTFEKTINCTDNNKFTNKPNLFSNSSDSTKKCEQKAQSSETTDSKEGECFENNETKVNSQVQQFRVSHSRSSSLKRVINWKFAPFRKKNRGAKPKLKSARSLPTDGAAEDKSGKTKKSNFNKSKSTSTSVRSNKDDSSIKSFRTKYIKQNQTSNSVEDDTEVLRGSPVCFRRAKSFDGHNLLPDRPYFIVQKELESSESYFHSTEPHSLFCYKKKKNGEDFYKFSSSGRNSTSSDQQSVKEKRSLSGSSGTDDSRMLFSLTNKSSPHDGATYSQSNSKQGSPKISKPRQLSTSRSLTNLVSMAKTSRIVTSSFGKGDVLQASNTGYFATKRLQELESFRRSTIGPGSENGSSLRGSNNTQRHSLHVMKVQSTSPLTSENSQSKPTKSGAGTSFHSFTPPHNLDKNFNITKTGSIKYRFQKSGKSNGKNSVMTSDELDKMTERTWNSKGKCVWVNMTGQQVKLSNVDLLSLSEIERIALQKVASQTLHNMDLGVSITTPKDESRLMNGKNSLLHLHFTTKASRTKAKKHDHVFAIPLVRVVENDQLLRLQTIEQDSTSTSYSNANDGTQDASDSDSLNPSSSGTSPKAGRRIPVSPSDQGAILKDCATSGSPGSDDVDSAFTPSPTTSSPRNATNTNVPVSRTMRRRHAINTGIDEDESQLLKSLSETSTKDKKRSDLIPSTMPQVPYVVQKCCAHIIKHGLDVTGIFRVPGSKKRVKQLREEFDRGVDVKVEDDYLAHDVAALLKEFFRDLPEALLTRELYQAFISTTKLNKADRLSALRCLVWLLPMPNRDTFQQLLSFLATVAEYSDDRTDANGNTICGNKMGIPNLSMIFGPNILHRNKKTSSSSNDAQYQVQSLERAEESTLVITVVEDMIRNHKDLFMVPKETHGEILHTLQETDPHALDVLLRRKAVNYSRIETPQSSSEHTSDGGSSDDEFTIASPPAVNSNNNNNNNKGEFLTFERYNQRSEANTPDSRKSDILETDSESTPVSASEHKISPQSDNEL